MLNSNWTNIEPTLNLTRNKLWMKVVQRNLYGYGISSYFLHEAKEKKELVPFIWCWHCHLLSFSTPIPCSLFGGCLKPTFTAFWIALFHWPYPWLFLGQVRKCLKVNSVKRLGGWYSFQPFQQAQLWLVSFKNCAFKSLLHWFVCTWNCSQIFKAIWNDIPTKNG